ncbi:MAG: endolytic transglycosylase MltG [Flavobacteriales bacterium]|nr:endolytic transglycosylase MltG [Flavobacteriales bacterium]
MRRLLTIGVILAAFGGVVAWYAYGKVMDSSTVFSHSQKEVFIPTGTSMDELITIVIGDSIVNDQELLEQVIELKEFARVKPGRYVFNQGMSMNQVVNKLRSGDQDAVRVTFTSARKPEDIAGKLTAMLEADSAEFLQLVLSEEQAARFGFNKENFRTMFIPNTYEMWWDTDAEELLERMAAEYRAFWTDGRKERAVSLGLSQSEVVTLASIVKAETAMREEAPIVAGLYLNRLKRGIPLQADPTLIYALDDYTIRRVLNEHMEVNSPYNTYLHSGLPPGPINFPETHYVDAVLNPDRHDYIYMCAKPALDGYHNFAKTLRQHNINANAYHRAISRRR